MIRLSLLSLVLIFQVKGNVSNNINSIQSTVTDVQSSASTLQIIIIVVLVLTAVFLFFSFILMIVQCCKKDQKITPDQKIDSEYKVKDQFDAQKNQNKYDALKSENISIAQINNQGITPVIKNDEHHQQLRNNEKGAIDHNRNSQWKIVDDI